MRCRCRPTSLLAQLRLAVVGAVAVALAIPGCAATGVRQTVRSSAARCDRLPIVPVGVPIGKPVHRLRVLEGMTPATASDAACWSVLREQACALGADAVIDAEIQQHFHRRGPILRVTGTAVRFVSEASLPQADLIAVSTRPGARTSKRSTGAQAKGLHSFDAIQKVTRQLQNAERAGGRQKVLEALRILAAKIGNGTFPGEITP